MSGPASKQLQHLRLVSARSSFLRLIRSFRPSASLLAAVIFACICSPLMSLDIVICAPRGVENGCLLVQQARRAVICLQEEVWRVRVGTSLREFVDLADAVFRDSTNFGTQRRRPADSCPGRSSGQSEADDKLPHDGRESNGQRSMLPCRMKEVEMEMWKFQRGWSTAARVSAGQAAIDLCTLARVGLGVQSPAAGELLLCPACLGEWQWGGTVLGQA